MPGSGVIHEALPGRYIDRIRDGVTGNRKAQFGALVSICMAAQLRGWNEPRLADLVCDPIGSALWRQISCDHKGKPFPEKTTRKTYADAWHSAELHLGDPENSINFDQTAVEAAYALHDLIEDDVSLGLTEPQHRTLTYVVDQVIEREWGKVTCPLRDIATSKNLGIQQVRTALTTLVQSGWLVKHSAGHRGLGGSGKASVYRFGPRAFA